MIKLKDLLSEGLFKTIVVDGKDVMIYKNPFTNEIKKCESHEMVGAFFTEKDCYVFNRHYVMHFKIKYELKPLLDNAVACLLYPNNTNVEIVVTDATRNTVWYHNPKTKSFLLNHPFLRSKYRNITVNYFDEDIIGDWNSL